ncbi:GNAT family N-acetyltransferase [Actinomyces minihominis]|uniref:GNAT family N-acetyltransferase n=1 Tax=Actinomyces minihominis TaxID=2002838 RepID=UPI000C0721B3|nr:GNAT family N-acetyltransferase [Actinomyces minihominis]
MAAEPTFTIRPYEPSDWADVGRVCVLTGASGSDATGQYASDELLPAIYAYPYVQHDPELAWVVEMEDEGITSVVGYVLGTADVTAFVRWWKTEWTPLYEDLLPVDGSWTSADRAMRRRGEQPETQVTRFAADYPAELHIDLLPEAQGRGLGRSLIRVFARAVWARGVRKLALGVGGENRGAQAFYQRLGFYPLAEEFSPEGELLGARLGLDVREFLEA